VQTTAPAATSTLAQGETPGYDPELGRKVVQSFKNAPLTAANVGGEIFNRLLLPPANLINSVTGATPVKKAKWMTKYPTTDEMLPAYLRKKKTAQ